MASGEAWKDACRSANNGFEQLVFETRKAAERLDRRHSLSLRLSSATRAAADRAREIDREFEVTRRWRTFSLDFRRNWPRYTKQLNDFFDTPLGKGFTAVETLWKPESDTFRGSTKGSSKSKSKPEIIDVEYEER